MVETITRSVPAVNVNPTAEELARLGPPSGPWDPSRPADVICRCRVCGRLNNLVQLAIPIRAQDAVGLDCDEHRTLSEFRFGDCPVRVLGTPEAPCFVAGDVGAALGIKNVRDTVRHFPEDEKGVGSTDTLGGQQQLLTLTEPGLYRLIFLSRKPAAERFRRWVFHEVLPQIRQAGRYESAPPARATLPPRVSLQELERVVVLLERLGRVPASCRDRLAERIMLAVR
jgi:prophage antirepressor-like protein